MHTGGGSTAIMEGDRAMQTSHNAHRWEYYHNGGDRAMQTSHNAHRWE